MRNHSNMTNQIHPYTSRAEFVPPRSLLYFLLLNNIPLLQLLDDEDDVDIILVHLPFIICQTQEGKASYWANGWTAARMMRK